MNAANIRLKKADVHEVIILLIFSKDKQFRLSRNSFSNKHLWEIQLNPNKTVILCSENILTHEEHDCQVSTGAENRTYKLQKLNEKCSVAYSKLISFLRKVSSGNCTIKALY